MSITETISKVNVLSKLRNVFGSEIGFQMQDDALFFANTIA